MKTIQLVEEVKCFPEQIITKAGETDNYIYFIEKGEAEIIIEN